MTHQTYLFKQDSDHQITAEFPADEYIHLLTTAGIRIPVHRTILVSASPVVLKNIINRPMSSERSIPILGVPSESVSVFVRFLYSSTCTEEEMEKYGFHLLTLSHVFAVPLLKQRCAKALVQRLKIDNVIDTLQLARLCDASELYFRSMKLASTNIKLVEKTEGWKFVQENDPSLELEILQFIDEIESRKKRTRRHREERSMCLQLSEAMECLEHICEEPGKKKHGPCQKLVRCRGLQLLFRHFATCKRRVNSRCYRCRRMLQLLHLHSSICDDLDVCEVPLCRQMKMNLKVEEKGKAEDEGKWKVFVRKVAITKAMPSIFHYTRDQGREDR